MLLDGERTGIDVEGEFTERNSPARQLFPSTTDGINEDLGDDVTDGKRRVSEGEELIDAGEDDDENSGQDPCSDSCKGYLLDDAFKKSCR